MPTRTSASLTKAQTAAGEKVTRVKIPTTGANKRSRLGRIRRKAARNGWVFETRPEYPLQGEGWEKFFTARSKDHTLAVAIKAQLEGWIKEWHEE
jgi:hypothetical protein